MESRDDDQGTALCVIDDEDPQVILAEYIMHAVAYRRRSDGKAQVLIPKVYRDRVRA